MTECALCGCTIDFNHDPVKRVAGVLLCQPCADEEEKIAESFEPLGDESHAE